MSLIIKNNEAWIIKIKGNSFYTIYDRVETVERDIYKIKKEVSLTKDVKLMKLSLTHNGGRLEESDDFWLKILLIMQKREKNA